MSDTSTDTTNTSVNDTSNNDVVDDDNDDDDDDDYTEDASQLLFSSFGKVTINDNSMVTVPDDRARDFARAATYFSHHTNRHTMTVDLGSTQAAKLFAKQLNSYARNHGLSVSPKRDETRITFRFAQPKASNGTSEVTVTHTEPTAPKPTVPAQRKNASK